MYKELNQDNMFRLYMAIISFYVN